MMTQADRSPCFAARRKVSAMPPRTLAIALQESLPRVHACRLVLSTCALLALVLGSAGPARAQLPSAVDNKGTEFFMAFLPQYSGGAHAVELHLTADVETDVTVHYPAIDPTFETTVTVQPGSIEVVSLPTQASSSWTNDAVSINTVRAFSDREFVTYMINLYQATSDAGLALPVDAINTDYVVASKNNYLDEFIVFAPFDDTTVTITPTVGFGTHGAGVPFDVVLNRGEGFFAQASGEFSGTLVSATRPVGLTNGNYCTQIPGAGGSGACDHIFEVAQPVQTWGNTVPVTNLPRRELGSIYRVYAAENETTVLLDGVAFGPVLDRGQYLEVSNATLEGETDLTGSHVFSSEQPIFVVQFMTGLPSGVPPESGGDPAMGNMIPSDQYLTSYTFATPGAGQFVDHFLTVIANDADLDTITLDGQPIGSETFSSIPGSGFSAALIPLAEGTHTTASANGHGITVEGFGSYDSYLYPGGAQFQAINTTDSNPPLCELTLESSDPILFVGTGTDDRPSEDTDGDGELDPGEDLNGNGIIDVDTGIFSVTLGSESQNLTLTVDPGFLPLDPTVSFEVAPTDPGLAFEGIVSVADGAQNVCVLQVGGEGIALSPDRAALDPGAEHTVTARVLDDTGEPVVGVEVTFEVLSGQNVGETGTDTTDENGEASFAYTGSGEPGWDVLVARATGESGPIESNQALVYWGSGIHAVSDWAEAVDLWTYEDDGGVEHTIGFVAAQSAGVQVLDVTNPLDVQALGSYEPALCQDANGEDWLFYADDVTFVEEQLALHVPAGGCGVHVVNIGGVRNPEDSNRPQAFGPEGPPLLEAYDAHVAGSDGWVEALAVRDGTAYVADYDALRIFDVSGFDGNPDTLDIGPELGALAFDPDVDGPVGNVALYEDAQNERLLALLATGQGMRVVDVDDPTSPLLIGSYQHPTALGENAITQDIAVDPRRRIVLLPAWVGGLSVVDISDPSAPAEVDTLPTSVAFYTADPDDGLIYATEGNAGLRVLDLEDGFLVPVASSDPIEVGSPGDDWAWDVMVADCVAYVTYGNLGTGAGGLQLTPLQDCGGGNDIAIFGDEDDADADGIADAEDNCLDIPNADQTDADLDGYGNACDADYDGDGSVGLGDFGIFSAAYGASASDGHYDARADHDANGAVGVEDFGTLSQLWGSSPGPSGLACAGSVPCP
jgi:hypothetical protein